MQDRSRNDSDVTDGLNIIQHAANLSLIHDLAVMTEQRDYAITKAEHFRRDLAVTTAQLAELTIAHNAVTSRVERAIEIIRNLELEITRLHRQLAQRSYEQWGK